MSILEKRTYYLPPVNLIGPGVLADVADEIQNLGVKRPLIVSDRPLVELGIAKRLTDVSR